MSKRVQIDREWTKQEGERVCDSKRVQTVRENRSYAEMKAKSANAKLSLIKIKSVPKIYLKILKLKMCSKKLNQSLKYGVF